MTLKMVNYYNNNNVKWDQHKDASDQILSKSDQLFQELTNVDAISKNGRWMPDHPPLILKAHLEPSALKS